MKKCLKYLCVVTVAFCFINHVHGMQNPQNSVSEGEESLSDMGYKDTILEVSNILNDWDKSGKIDPIHQHMLHFLCDKLLETAHGRFVKYAVPVFVRLVCGDKKAAGELFIKFVQSGKSAKEFFEAISNDKEKLKDLTWFFNMLVDKFGLK